MLPRRGDGDFFRRGYVSENLDRRGNAEEDAGPGVVDAFAGTLGAAAAPKASKA